MHVTWKHVALSAIGLIVAGMIFAWSGLFNVAASSGHWQVTDWFLHWVMRNSVRTQAIRIEAPPADDPALLPAAAGHFASGCAPCHGAPGEERSPVVMEMTPKPPDLAAIVGEWRDRELFWIVNHGVKFTGMPAWPTQDREDEVWAMVAFLRALPEMDEERYRQLAFGDAEGSPALTDASTAFDDTLADCARCHDEDGSGRSTGIPIIASQNEAYLLASLSAYARSNRASGIMQKATADADPELLDELAAHFAGRPPVVTTTENTEGDVARGREIAERGDAVAGIPACLSCHDGNDRNPVFPLLDGQHAAYIRQQLELFKEEHRGGTAYAHLMQAVAAKMTEEDMRDAAAYFASRPAD